MNRRPAGGPRQRWAAWGRRRVETAGRQPGIRTVGFDGRSPWHPGAGTGMSGACVVRRSAGDGPPRSARNRTVRASQPGTPRADLGGVNPGRSPHRWATPVVVVLVAVYIGWTQAELGGAAMT